MEIHQLSGSNLMDTVVELRTTEKIFNLYSVGCSQQETCGYKESSNVGE